jgi:hypothetical protein
VQDEVTREIVTALALKLNEGEQRRIAHKGTDNLDAYDHYLRGRQLVFQRSRTGVEEADLSLTPRLAASPAGMLQFCPQPVAFGMTGDQRQVCLSEAAE